jgi:molybdate transport system substrate-binding protein
MLVRGAGWRAARDEKNELGGQKVAVVRILSGGAAQAVAEAVAEIFERETGHAVRAEFSAVGAMKARILAGEAVDIVILTDALISELIASGQVEAGSRAELGRVGTGVAVRRGTPVPDVRDAHVLRGNLLAARKIVCPDPETATAGKVVMRLLEKLGIAADVKARLGFFPNGYAAMRWLAASSGLNEIGITQITEIRASPGVKYVGPLPGDLHQMTLYSAGLAARTQHPDAARDFVARLVSPAGRARLIEAGYELDHR